MALTFERHHGGEPGNATVTSTSAIIVPFSKNRQYCLIQNDSDATIYLALGHDAEIGKGIRLNAGGGSYEINYTNLYLGDVYAITGSGSKNVTIQTGA